MNAVSREMRLIKALALGLICSKCHSSYRGCDITCGHQHQRACLNLSHSSQNKPLYAFIDLQSILPGNCSSPNISALCEALSVKRLLLKPAVDCD